MNMQTLQMLVMVVGATIAIMLYLEKKFAEARKLVHQLERHFNQVMSLHNREDDDRLLALQESQWELREYIARRDGTKSPHRKPFPRRRYLQGDVGDSCNERQSVSE